MPDTQRPMAVTLQVVSIVLFTFIGYLNIGIPLAVLPGYVHSQLGYGAVIAGLVITLLWRKVFGPRNSNSAVDWRR